MADRMLEYPDESKSLTNLTLGITSVARIEKIVHIALRAVFESTHFYHFQARTPTTTQHNQGCLLQLPYPCLPVYETRCLVGQYRLLHSSLWNP